MHVIFFFDASDQRFHFVCREHMRLVGRIADEFAREIFFHVQLKQINFRQRNEKRKTSTVPLQPTRKSHSVLPYMAC